MKITKNLAKVISKILKFLQRRLVMVVLLIVIQVVWMTYIVAIIGENSGRGITAAPGGLRQTGRRASGAMQKAGKAVWRGGERKGGAGGGPFQFTAGRQKRRGKIAIGC